MQSSLLVLPRCEGGKQTKFVNLIYFKYSNSCSPNDYGSFSFGGILKIAEVSDTFFRYLLWVAIDNFPDYLFFVAKEYILENIEATEPCDRI